MNNLNPYIEQEYSAKFTQTDIYKRLSEDFDYVCLSKFYFASPHLKTGITPRQMIGSYSTRDFSACIFYYIDFLLETNPQQIVDLGCGWNIFKKYIPTVIGIGAENPHSPQYYADQHDYVDNVFVQGHQDQFESVFSICSLHFHPLQELSKVINDFYSMIKPGGRGFLALNLQRMIDESNDKFMPGSTRAEYEAYCRAQLSRLDHIKFLVVDVDLQMVDEGLDGNVRLVMEK